MTAPHTPIDRTGDSATPVSAPRTARDWARIRLTEQILAVAREQLATQGAAGLSLRAIARELSMSSSAIYRYFASRDELLTALIIEAYNGLGAAVEGAEISIARRETYERWVTACRAVRTWALEHPHQYALIYGSPVPGYQAPTDTVLPATRVSTVLTLILVDCFEHGAIAADALNDPVSEAGREAMRPILLQFPPQLPESLVARALLVFAALFGAVSFELFGQFHNVIESDVAARDAWFDVLIERWAEIIGMRPGATP